MSEAIEALWETNPEAAKHFVRQLERENAALRETLEREQAKLRVHHASHTVPCEYCQAIDAKWSEGK